jgi:sugar/nucleoside kinase (ribokinase family)
MTTPLTIVGSVALDTIETRAGKREEILGGAATYIAFAAGVFTPVNLVAVVGDDFPKEYADLMADHGVDLQGLKRVKGRTFRWAGRYAEDFSTRETLGTELGVFETFDPEIPAAYRTSGFALLGNIHPALQLKVLDALPKETFVAADTMNLWIDTTPDALAEVIRRVNLLIINDEEAAMLTGELQVRVAARKIIEGGLEFLIIKRGEHGAYLFTREAMFFAPALPLDEVVDPTGAGDSFAGGLMGHLAGRGEATLDAIKTGMVYGAAVASRAVEAFGADEFAKLKRAEVDERVGALVNLVALP